MPKIIVVGGTHATGKTTSIQEAVALVNRKKTGLVDYVSVGDELRKHLKRRDLSGSTIEQLRVAWQKIFRNIKRKKNKVVILDDHYTYVPGDSTEHMDLWKTRREQIGTLLPTPVHYVLLETPVDEIKIRAAGELKPRPGKNIDIAREIVSQRICARAQARETGKPLTIIRNDTGMQDETIRRIEEIVRRHL